MATAPAIELVTEELTRRAGEPISLFRPYGEQQAFVEAAADRTIRFVRGGNRSGKTEAAAYDVAAHLLDQHPNYHWGRPLKAVATAPGWDGIGHYMWPKLKQFIPPRYIEDISWLRRSHPETPTDILLTNGSSVAFKSADQAVEKFASTDLDLCWVDEEIPELHADEMEARLVDRGGMMVVSFSPIKSLAWMRRWEKRPQVQVFRLRMSENPHIDQSAVAQFFDGKSEATKLKRDAGEYAAAEGLVYPALADEERAPNYLHIRGGRLVDMQGNDRYPWPLPEAWPRQGGVDFGFVNPAVLLAAAIDPDGRAIVYHCMYESGTRPSIWAAEQRQALGIGSGALNWAHIWADHDATERAELEGAGIHTTPAVGGKNIILGIERVRDRLAVQADGLPRLFFILPECLPGVDEAGNYAYPTNETSSQARKNLPLDAHNHFWDAVRYLVTGLDGISGNEVELDNLFGFGGRRR